MYKLKVMQTSDSEFSIMRKKTGVLSLFKKWELLVSCNDIDDALEVLDTARKVEVIKQIRQRINKHG